MKNWKDQIKKCRPMDFLDYRLFLDSLYAGAKREDSTYTYQKFASDCGFSASTIMHQIVRGYRPLTAKAAAKVARALKLDAHDKHYFLLLVDYCNAESAAERQSAFEKMLEAKEEEIRNPLEKDYLTYFGEWHHPVIRELVSASNFRSDAEWIVKRLTPKISIDQVKESLTLLERLGFIAFDTVLQKHVQTQNRISTGHQTESMALISFHQQMMKHAEEALTKMSPERRDISGVTVTVSEQTARRLRQLVHTFQLQLLDEAEKAGDGDQVYQINIQLFPFTE